MALFRRAINRPGRDVAMGEPRQPANSRRAVAHWRALMDSSYGLATAWARGVGSFMVATGFDGDAILSAIFRGIGSDRHRRRAARAHEVQSEAINREECLCTSAGEVDSGLQPTQLLGGVLGLPRPCRRRRSTQQSKRRRRQRRRWPKRKPPRQLRRRRIMSRCGRRKPCWSSRCRF